MADATSGWLVQWLMAAAISGWSEADGGNYIVKAVNSIGEKDCTLALNFGGGNEDEGKKSRFFITILLISYDHTVE